MMMIIIIILKQNTQAFKPWITENIKSDFFFHVNLHWINKSPYVLYLVKPIFMISILSSEPTAKENGTCWATFCVHGNLTVTDLL